MSSETNAKETPTINRNEPSASIPINSGTTPAENSYSCTPGGSRITYDRNTLLNLANSPLAKTPPTGMAFVPGVTMVNSNDTQSSHQNRGLLAPPQLFPGLQQQLDEPDGDNKKESDSTEKPEDTHEQQKDQQNDHMFEMEME